MHSGILAPCEKNFLSAQTRWVLTGVGEVRPDLDEDHSFRGLLAGDYGQQQEI
jgi:hypothetical protein